ncbi:uncharacterized protein [Tursiops truncatus]|uniref:uncharacterized protein n=1 Tax=Tursiops truncatus TaxID=9739 RepID=UPI003CCF9D6E
MKRTKGGAPLEETFLAVDGDPLLWQERDPFQTSEGRRTQTQPPRGQTQAPFSLLSRGQGRASPRLSHPEVAGGPAPALPPSRRSREVEGRSQAGRNRVLTVRFSGEPAAGEHRDAGGCEEREPLGAAVGAQRGPGLGSQPRPEPRAPYRGVGAAASPGLPPRLPDQQQEGAAVRAGPVARQHAPGGVAAPLGQATARLAVAAAPWLPAFGAARGLGPPSEARSGRGHHPARRKRDDSEAGSSPRRPGQKAAAETRTGSPGRGQAGPRPLCAPRGEGAHAAGAGQDARKSPPRGGGHTSWKVLWKDPYPPPPPPAANA